MMMTMAIIDVDVDLIKSASILCFRGRCALVLLVEGCFPSCLCSFWSFSCLHAGPRKRNAVQLTLCVPSSSTEKRVIEKSKPRFLVVLMMFSAMPTELAKRFSI